MFVVEENCCSLSSYGPEICMNAAITVAAWLGDAPLNASKRQQSCQPTESEANYSRSITEHLPSAFALSLSSPLLYHDLLVSMSIRVPLAYCVHAKAIACRI